MPVTIDNIPRRIWSGVREVYIGPDRVSAYDAAGAPIVQAGAPPTITTIPSISGGTIVSDILSLDLGAADGSPVPTASWLWHLDGAALAGEDGLSIDTSNHGEGEYTVEGAYSNGVSPSATFVTNSIDVTAAAAPGVDYSQALIYFDADTPYSGSAADVTEIAAEGSAGVALAKTGTAAIERTADGFQFADTGYLSGSGIPAGATADGMFLVVDFTQDSVGSNWARLSDGAGSRMRLQINTSNQSITGTGADDTNVNIPLGTATLGTRHVVAFQMDDVLDQLTGYDASGASVGPISHGGLTDPASTRIDIGQFVNGTVHRWCLVGRPEGGAWPITMDEVFADFQAGA